MLTHGLNTLYGIQNSLCLLPHKFVLTGSRFFGGARPNSDWDYFTQDTPDIRDQLTALGFQRLPHHNYLDTNTVDVFELNIPSEGTIQIQIVKDSEMKEQVQSILRATKLLKIAASKTCRTMIWNTAFRLYQRA